MNITLSGTATESDFKDLLNELEIMTAVGQHPNLVNLIGACSLGGEWELNIEHPSYWPAVGKRSDPGKRWFKVRNYRTFGGSLVLSSLSSRKRRLEVRDCNRVELPLAVLFFEACVEKKQRYCYARKLADKGFLSSLLCFNLFLCLWHWGNHNMYCLGRTNVICPAIAKDTERL